MRRKVYVLAVLFVILVVKSVAVFTVGPFDHTTKQAVVPVTKAVEKEKVEKSAYPGLDITTVTTQGERYTSSISKPKTESEKINKEVHTWIDVQEQEFLDTVKQNAEALKLEPAHLNINVNINKVTDDIYSLVFHSYQYVGGANGQEFMQTFIIDIKGDRILHIEDVMDIDDEVRKHIHELVKAQLQKKEEDYFQVFYDDLETVLAEPSTWKWALDHDTFSLYFDSYAVAAGAAGAIHVEIPTEEIVLYLKDDIADQLYLAEEKQERKKAVEQEQAVLDPEGKYVALTFDDGPHPNVTPSVLETLQQFDARATFYMIATQVSVYPDLANEVALQGHELGNHSVNHLDMTKLSSAKIADELEKTSAEIEKATGLQPKTMRPPYGAYNEALLSVAETQQLPVINWSVDSLDWKSRNAAAVKQEVLNHVHNGAIILMHDIHPSTAEALPDVMSVLEEEGYEFVTVSELLSLQDNANVGPYTNKK
ncbi:polysaccharide deacetylase family protein [Shouchella lonarensis]|uniref:polysaccharide deacetylase family protein n=1 Tax=Shouchella lonarensis TaxID=1464122 RepID=UPI000B8A37EB|nr:polysaccharide deacetylase family protein [Shouchella lonarensis]